jgi:two-component system phosphate regulon response regulator PhoB
MTEMQCSLSNDTQRRTRPVVRAVSSLLILSEEPSTHAAMIAALKAVGYFCHTVTGIPALHSSLREKIPDVLVLDCVHSAAPAIDCLRELRRNPRTCDIPIIMLIGAETSLEHRVTGLDSGADDYVVSPVAEREFLARVRALLRRCGLRGMPRVEASSSYEETVLGAAGLELDLIAHRVIANGKVCPLGPTEFQLLRIFLSHRENVFSRRELLEQVRGPDTPVDVRAIDVFVRRLRQALAPHDCARFIQTVHRSGYRFSDKADAL